MPRNMEAGTADPKTKYVEQPRAFPTPNLHVHVARSSTHQTNHHIERKNSGEPTMRI